MPNTPHGLPYPPATDPVAQGAAAIQALASAVDLFVGGLDYVFGYNPGGAYVNGGAGVGAFALNRLDNLPPGKYLILGRFKVTWQNTLGAQYAAYWDGKDGAGTRTQYQVGIAQRPDGIMIIPFVVTVVAAGGWVQINGIDGSTINQGDWGSTFSERALIALRLKDALGTVSLAELADDVDELPENAPPDYVGPNSGPYTPEAVGPPDPVGPEADV